MLDIVQNFPITESEFLELDKKFGDLCQYQGWQLIKKNSRNNILDSHEDIVQDLKIAMLRAASYYKRQIYIEKCLELCGKHAKDIFIKSVVTELQHLWKNKTRHGANRQKYGPHQEKMLEKLVRCLVPKDERPNKKAPLVIDTKFTTYCKAISWNQQKSMGKKITREKSIRNGLVSLSQFDYLGGE